MRASAKASSFTESVIREMTRLANLHGAINLGQGFPDFTASQEVKDAAAAAIAADHNQYPITWGVPAFREAIAAKYARDYGMTIDPETEICVTCGSTEAMVASMLGVLDPGDEVVIFEPHYENYGPDAILAGASPRYVALRPPDWTFDEAELRAAFTDRTRAVIVNTPNNPTGKVFSVDELSIIADLCVRHDAIAITDEIYEHITYDGCRHVPIATIPGMRDRTITISALSKTYSVTGWRVGWAIATPALMGGIRAVHDFLTVCGIRRASRRHRPRARPGGVRGAPSSGRLLRDGRRRAPRHGRRRRRREAPHRGRRRGRGPRLLVLLPPRARAIDPALRVLQEAGHARGRRRAPPASPALMRARRRVAIEVSDVLGFRSR